METVTLKRSTYDKFKSLGAIYEQKMADLKVKHIHELKKVNDVLDKLKTSKGLREVSTTYRSNDNYIRKEVYYLNNDDVEKYLTTTHQNKITEASDIGEKLGKQRANDDCDTKLSKLTKMSWLKLIKWRNKQRKVTNNLPKWAQ
jgi:protein involved in sex pheromone biosynthesis